MTNQNAEGTESNPSQTQETGPRFSPETTKKCIDITERFRAGVIAKVGAILELRLTIPRDDIDESTYLEALGAYIRVLDNFERVRERGAPRGVPVEGGDPGHPGADDDTRSRQSPEVDGQGPVVAANKRGRSGFHRRFFMLYHIGFGV